MLVGGSEHIEARKSLGKDSASCTSGRRTRPKETVKIYEIVRTPATIEQIRRILGDPTINQPNRATRRALQRQTNSEQKHLITAVRQLTASILTTPGSLPKEAFFLMKNLFVDFFNRLQGRDKRFLHNWW